MNDKKLIRVKTYADKMKKSTTWVYNQIDAGLVKSEEIDGIIFIVLADKKDKKDKKIPA